MTPSSKSFLTVEQLGEGRGENSVEAMAAQREEKRGENSLEAMPAQIPTDLCIGTCGHLPEQLQKRMENVCYISTRGSRCKER